METVRVNMTPNNEVKTIHCSQNDGKTRKWGFELYKEDGIIDSSSIESQMIYDCYKGGTEQIIPENTSVPTTSPIIADIQYPDALRSEQEFLYRECPSNKDGQARIARIKGNTVKFNQLVQNGNFADTSAWSKTSTTTLTVSGNVATVVYNGGTTGGRITQGIARKAGHKYLISCEFKLSSISDSVEPIIVNNGSELIRPGYADSTSWKAYSLIFDQLADDDGSTANNFRICSIAAGTATSVEVRNVNMHDLTEMYLETLSVSQFRSMFPLMFYAYDTGSLLSFNGTGLKTTGKNQWVPDTLIPKKIIDNGVISDTTVNGTWISDEMRVPSDATSLYIAVFAKAQYSAGSIQTFASNDGVHFTTIGSINNTNQITDGYKVEYSIPSGTTVIRLFGYMGNNTDGVFTKTMSLGISFAEMDSYEPYTTNTLSLPISTYFPIGMKSAGSVYDELTENKATTRIGSRAYQSGDESDTSVITDGTTTYYPLTTPTETDITTASLVTDNGETPLYCDDDILKADCLTALSSEAGIFDAKIKLMDDETVYSQKIQLHVERKP